MFDHTRSLLLVLAAGGALAAADVQPPAEGAALAPKVEVKPADKPAPLEFDGVIQTKKGVILRVVKDPKDQKEPKDKVAQPFELTDKTRITLDGKDSDLKHLQPEMPVKVAYDAKGVIGVDATSPKKKGTK